MKNKGITLIALVITIIILLILAGVSISLVVGENGILTRANEAVVITEIKEIEEQARLHYMDRKVDEITGGENATIAGVISDLKAEGYHIEERVSGATIVTGIVLNENSIKLNKNSEASLTYTLVYGEGTVRYYAEVRGKYYEIINENENIVVRTEETNLEGIDNAPKVTAQSNAENIATARTDENDTIVINSLNELGEAIVTVKEENSGTTITCNVKVMTIIEQISFKQDTITIEKGNNVELNTLVTINPTDATEELVWSTGNGEIIEITEDGKLVGVKEGTTTIKVTNEAGTIEATCQVKVVISATGINLNKSTTTINKGNTDSLTVTLTPADTTDPVNWASENTTIATITPDATGRTATITAKGAGTTKITVTCGSKTAYCTVTVKVPATGLTISQENAKIKIGDTLQLIATVTPTDTSDLINWTSSNANVVSITTDSTKNVATITGLKVGTSTIIVSCGSQNKTCIVTVERFSEINTNESNPEGALPSGNVEIIEADATKGIVIKDKNNIEWVWIQVPKNVVFKTAKSSTDYANIKNDLITYAGIYRHGAKGQTFNYDDTWSNSCGIASSSDYLNKYYNVMLKSVYENGGFWIQRYEDERSFLICATAQDYANKMSPDEVKTSSLLFGIQWDLVCKYLEGKDGLTQYDIYENSYKWGKYRNTDLKARTDDTKRMNIYDFAGNLVEWTLESNNGMGNVPRGHIWNILNYDSDCPASFRNSASSGSLNSNHRNYTFRATFY